MEMLLQARRFACLACRGCSLEDPQQIGDEVAQREGDINAREIDRRPGPEDFDLLKLIARGRGKMVADRRVEGDRTLAIQLDDDAPCCRIEVRRQ